jgi:hypothetical protein
MLNKKDINARLKKSLQGKTPKLKCLVTGIERITTMDYLKTKEEKFGTIDNFVNSYISSDAIRSIKQGNSLNETRDKFNSFHILNESKIKEALKYYNL